jgi:hypothetical protein
MLKKPLDTPRLGRTIRFRTDIPSGQCRCGCGEKTELIKINNASLGLVKGEYRDFVKFHAARVPIDPRAKACGSSYEKALVVIGDALLRPFLEGRFWNSVNKNGPLPKKRPTLGRCWIWTGTADTHGYGRIGLGPMVFGMYATHRLSYLLQHGMIPAGLDIDHLCRVPLCCNPHHLEAVSRRINLLRGEGPTAIHARVTECPQGHPYDIENTAYSVKPKGNTTRYCKQCNRDRANRNRAKGKN